MATTITVTRDDYGYNIDFTVTDVDGTAFDTSGATSIKFKVGLPTNTTLLLDGTCTTTGVTPTDGECRYVVVDEDFDTTGEYQAELEITWSGYVRTCRGLVVKIVDDLPRVS